MKIVNYFVRLFLIFVVLVIAKSSADVYNIAVENDNVNKTVNLSTMALKIIEVEKELKYTAKDTYTGDLTGYAYNCPLCGGTLGCMPSYNVKDGTLTYPDKEYGVVNIVASSKNLPCGSIVRFKKSGQEMMAIVLDRGVLGNDLDLLSPSEEYASKYVGRRTITYDVLRSGWN